MDAGGLRCADCQDDADGSIEAIDLDEIETTMSKIE
jgi:hypothetical protein